ncbi:hypothetical protein BsWGS_08287 [Bradybaena similaris]
MKVLIALLAFAFLASVDCYRRLPVPPCDTYYVNCAVSPCRFNTCDAVPEAICVANYCGGCNARWYRGSEDVTDQCTPLYPS